MYIRYVPCLIHRRSEEMYMQVLTWNI
ncbi:hypothetical protein Gogos_008120 [Gossypium gossypioides]|uniref:Uncharacterized protein n=1 Tax=Gossypium gossypioides TaxID=34282 RepID=A0A7J9CAW6_GOSGO|nr:hypothetical protein [Gossypium gossypioides]